MDVWRELTKTALRRINDLDDARAPLDVNSIVSATLDEFRDVPDAHKSRARLEAFVRDLIDDRPPSA